MNEDEAFIRAIVDSPGDDLPRLVYADWLDDHADPRGPYLRAEAEWAKPWRSGERPPMSQELLQLAANIDPVWVARVSRPPMGVCLMHIGMTRFKDTRDVKGLITRDELASFESDVNIELAADHVAFLLNQNGCVLEKCSIQSYRRVPVEGDDDAEDDEYGSEPLYDMVLSGRVKVTLTLYPIQFSYREDPEGDWEYEAGISVEETAVEGAMIQADLYKVFEIGRNTGAIPGVFRRVVEDFTDEDCVGRISHYSGRSNRRVLGSHDSFSELFASLAPLS